MSTYIPCDYCGNDMADGEYPWRIEMALHEGTEQYHTGCREAAEAMRSSAAMHRLYCHAPDCEWRPRGPAFGRIEKFEIRG